MNNIIRRNLIPVHEELIIVTEARRVHREKYSSVMEELIQTKNETIPFGKVTNSKYSLELQDSFFKYYHTFTNPETGLILKPIEPFFVKQINRDFLMVKELDIFKALWTDAVVACNSIIQNNLVLTCYLNKNLNYFGDNLTFGEWSAAMTTMRMSILCLNALDTQHSFIL